MYVCNHVRTLIVKLNMFKPSTQEVRQGLKRMKGKSVGFDEIPSAVLYADHCISFLTKLFRKCFEKGKVPSSWGKGIINPIQNPHATIVGILLTTGENDHTIGIQTLL